MWNNQHCVKWQISYSRRLIIAALHTVCTGNEDKHIVRLVSLHHAAVGLFKSISFLIAPYLTFFCWCQFKTKRTQGGTGDVLFCKPVTGCRNTCRRDKFGWKSTESAQTERFRLESSTDAKLPGILGSPFTCPLLTSLFWWVNPKTSWHNPQREVDKMEWQRLTRFSRIVLSSLSGRRVRCLFLHTFPRFSLFWFTPPSDVQPSPSVPDLQTPRTVTPTK